MGVKFSGAVTMASEASNPLGDRFCSADHQTGAHFRAGQVVGSDRLLPEPLGVFGQECIA